MPTDDHRSFFQGIPHFFRVCCACANRGREGGYSNPGYHLAIHLAELIEPDDNDEPDVKLDELLKPLAGGDDEAVLMFLCREFPRCMRLVPRRRRRQFL